MPTLDFIQHAFVAGELSPTLYGRSDIEKFDLGLSLAYNAFIDYRGGVSSRPGTEFGDYIKSDSLDTRMFKFVFAPNDNDVFVLFFGHNYLRFIQNNAYVLEATKTITGASKADPGVITSVAHGYSSGDWIIIQAVGGMTELNTRTFEITKLTNDTYSLQDPFGVDFDTTSATTYTSGGTSARIYTITTTFASTDLATLKLHQNKNLVRITHKTYGRFDLIRLSDTNWTLTATATGAELAAPVGLVSTPSGSASAGMLWVVTAINAAGEESVGSIPLVEDSSINYLTTPGSLKLTWTAVMNAVSYNIYRSLILAAGSDVHKGMTVGFVGTTFGPEFTDNNITADFTATPPNFSNPFADGAITYIEVTAGGSGYTQASVVTISGGDGTGFLGFPIVNSSGAVIAVVIINEGSGYTTGTVAFTIGTSATATPTFGSNTGNKPGTVSVFQQRQIYAGTDNQPLTIFGSRPRLFDNFDVTRVLVDNDSYEYDLDEAEASPIDHLLPTRQGMLAMSRAGIFRVTGGAEISVTPLNAVADPQSVTGVSAIPPLTIDVDILYIESKGSTVRLLKYSELTKAFAGTDVSLLSNHFFTAAKQPVSWDYAKEPFKLVWMVRSDGAMLAFTTVPEQNVFAWTQNFTKGQFKDVIVVEESNEDRVYVTTRRYINSRWTKFFERMDTRDFIEAEDSWCVDAGLMLGQTEPAAELTVAAATGSGITATASTSVFTSGNVGDIIRSGGGKMEIATYVSGTEVTVDIIRDLTSLVPEDSTNRPLEVASGDWTMDTPVLTAGGLWHLEGETVQILADGNVKTPVVVVNGSVTWVGAATRVLIGLGFQFRVITLPLTSPQGTIEGRRQRIVAVVARMNETRGLKVGASANKLYELKERTTEKYGEPIMLINELKHIVVASSFTREALTYYQQDYPLPATILGVIADVEIGDDRD